MSFNVLLLAEDITHDQHLIRPVVEGLLKEIGATHAIVRPCLDPRFRGIAQATDPARLVEVYRQYPMVDAFVLCVDRDGEDAHAAKVRRAEEAAQEIGVHLFGAAAHQELEVWALAGCADFSPADYGFGSWEEVRADPDVKERAFEPFAQVRGVAIGVGGGRKALGLEAGSRYRSRVRKKCPEVRELEDRIAAWLRTRT